MDSNLIADLTGLGFLAAFGVILFVLLAALYVYVALAWQTIAKRLGHKYPWLAWIPFANIAMILQLGGFHWAWVFLMLVPFAGWLAVIIMMIIAMWRIFERRKYPGWLSLIVVLMAIPFISTFAGIGYLVIIGLVAWSKK